MKTNIYTISAINVNNEENVNCKESYTIYYSFEEALSSAISLAKNLHNEEDVYDISLFYGEEQDDDGYISGEPTEIYIISNKPRRETIEARLEADYVCGEVDGYIANGVFEFEDKKFKL